MVKKNGIRKNDLCPCGSGKKYKYCCGWAEETYQVSKSKETIDFSRQISYLGTIGEKRQAFCLEYVSQKRQIFELITQNQEGIAEREGLRIICHKGCSTCCNALVQCSLQEGEVITYYLLNQNETALNSFLEKFPAWISKTHSHEDVIIRTMEIQEKMVKNHSVSPQDLEGVLWTDLQMYCPFLMDNACSIHEVRPVACANFISLGDVCRTPSSKSFWMLLPPNIEMSFWDSRPANLPQYIMPKLVYNLLTGSFKYLAQIPGLETLLDEFYQDPSVQRFAAELKK